MVVERIEPVDAAALHADALWLTRLPEARHAGLRAVAIGNFCWETLAAEALCALGWAATDTFCAVLRLELVVSNMVVFVGEEARFLTSAADTEWFREYSDAGARHGTQQLMREETSWRALPARSQLAFEMVCANAGQLLPAWLTKHMWLNGVSATALFFTVDEAPKVVGVLRSLHFQATDEGDGADFRQAVAWLMSEIVHPRASLEPYECFKFQFVLCDQDNSILAHRNVLRRGPETWQEEVVAQRMLLPLAFGAHVTFGWPNRSAVIPVKHCSTCQGILPTFSKDSASDTSKSYATVSRGCSICTCSDREIRFDAC